MSLLEVWVERLKQSPGEGQKVGLSVMCLYRLWGPKQVVTNLLDLVLVRPLIELILPQTVVGKLQRAGLKAGFLLVGRLLLQQRALL